MPIDTPRFYRNVCKIICQIHRCKWLQYIYLFLHLKLQATSSISTAPEVPSTPDLTLTPKTCKRKSRLAYEVVKFVKDLSENYQVDVMTLALKKLGLLNRFKRKPTKSGRKLTAIEFGNFGIPIGPNLP